VIFRDLWHKIGLTMNYNNGRIVLQERKTKFIKQEEKECNFARHEAGSGMSERALEPFGFVREKRYG
jgi:hypothetical protein